MKVCFQCSPRPKNSDVSDILAIYKKVSDLGYQHVTNIAVEVDLETFYDESTGIAKEFFKDISKLIKEADICLFETSVSSLGIGHVIAMALNLNKPVIVLYQGEKRPMLLSEIKDEHVQVINYTVDTLDKVLADALEFARGISDTRFNFFISPRHSTYLDWISQHRRVPRSVYLRNLIKRDMEENSDYAEL